MKKSTLTALLLLFSVVWLAAQQPVTVSNVPHVICDSGCSGTTLGQATMANSLPVAIASNQSAVPVSGTVAVTNANLDVALSTLAKESGGNLATIATNTNGVATAANQTTMNTNLTSLVTNTGLAARETGGNLDYLVDQLSTLINDLHGGKVPNVNDRAGLNIRGSFNNQIGSIGDALKVAPTPTSFDPCFMQKKGNVAISQTATTKLVSGIPGQVISVCYARIVAGAAEIPSFWEGTGSACATGTVAVSGSATAASGESYAANGGFSGGVGLGTIAVTSKPGNDLCLAQSGSNRLSGNITFVFGTP